MDHLAPEEVFELGVSASQALDISALEVYQALQARDVDMSPRLFPASSYTRNYYAVPGDHVPVYYALFKEIGNSTPDEELLQLIYDNGFTSIDACDRYNETPLFYACDWIWNRSESRTQSIHWLLDKGADTRFRSQDGTPNIFFPLAREHGRLIRGDLSPQRNIGDTISHILARSEGQPLSTDGCQCYCSHLGCSPLSRFWSCHYEYCGHRSCQGVHIRDLLGAVEGWIQMCTLDKDQALQCYKQAMKLEIFDRLGMTHTCCQNQFRTRLGPLRMSIEEKARVLEDYARNEHPRLREEDEVLKEQLELLTLGYLKRFESHVGTLSCFWETAMLDLSRILPDPSPEGRCRGRCLPESVVWSWYWRSPGFSRKEEQRHNAMLDAQAALLKQNGYEGWDFIDVIRHHFRDCFGDESGPTIGPDDPGQTSSAL